MRKLASIQKIKQLIPIAGADRIELALVQGWQCVVTKGEYTPGDMTIFYEIDSFLPADDIRYESFEPRFVNWGDKRGMRLRTIKLKKQLSQGLCMPLHKFPEITGAKEGDDVTELLKIEKWEAPEENANITSGSRTSSNRKFPQNLIRKTDQERVQNMEALLLAAYDSGEVFEETIKLDGSSLSAAVVFPDSPYYKEALSFKKQKTKSIIESIKFWFKDKFSKHTEPVYLVCSRNMLLNDNDSSRFWEAVNKYDIIKKLGEYGKSICLQGELIAPDIQNNFEGVTETELHIFDVWDINSQKYLSPLARAFTIGAMGDDILHVPVTATYALRDKFNRDTLVADILNHAEGAGLYGPKREGLVFKSMSRDFSFKAISNSYLLQKK